MLPFCIAQLLSLKGIDPDIGREEICARQARPRRVSGHLVEPNDTPFQPN
jgi:hypothetical protein